MKRNVTMILAMTLVAASLVSTAVAADAPADRVVAMYFHRTKRCPTCQKMGSYSEEAVKKQLAKEVKAGTVEFHYIDFQNQKNAALKKAYKVTGPALVVAKVEANKVKEFKSLKEIWAKVGEKPKFMAYVVDNVKAYMK